MYRQTNVQAGKIIVPEQKAPTTHREAVAALYAAPLAEPFFLSCRLDIDQILQDHFVWPPELIPEIRRLLHPPDSPLQAELSNTEAQYFSEQTINSFPEWFLMFTRQEAPPEAVMQEPEIDVLWEDLRTMQYIQIVLRPMLSDAVLFTDWRRMRDVLHDPHPLRPLSRPQNETAAAIKPAGALPERILKQRRESIDQFVADMVAAVAKDPVPANAEQRIAAREIMWKFFKRRKKIWNEAMTLTQLILSGSNAPEVNLSILRLALALYWLAAVADWSRIAVKSNKPSLLSLVLNAAAGVERILHDDYFRLTDRDIINLFLDEEHVLTACAAACGKPLLTLEQAAAKYKNNVADMAEVCERELKRKQ